jgi:membrane-associated phospholipid phosphatase
MPFIVLLLLAGFCFSPALIAGNARARVESAGNLSVPDDSLKRVGSNAAADTAAGSVAVEKCLIDSTNSEWIYPVAAGASLVVFHFMYRLDQNSYRFLYNARKKSPAMSDVSSGVTNGGDGLFSVGVFAPCYLIGLLTDDEKITRVGRLGLGSYVLTGISVQLLKHLFCRERPSEATMPGGRFHVPFSYFTQKPGSKRSLAAFDAFPSGHTATIFSMAAVFNAVYDKESWLPYVTYSMASLVALSRITEQTHWLSDCIAGAAIGIVLTELLDHWEESHAITVQSSVLNDSQGLSIGVRF